MRFIVDGITHISQMAMVRRNKTIVIISEEDRQVEGQIVAFKMKDDGTTECFLFRPNGGDPNQIGQLPPEAFQSVLAPLPEETASRIDPGIRNVVATLREVGFNVCDAADGSPDSKCQTHSFVMIHVLYQDLLVFECERLYAFLQQIGIDVKEIDLDEEGNPKPGVVALRGSYDPMTHIAMIEVVGITDKMLAALTPKVH